MLNGRLDDAVIVPALDALPGLGYRAVCLHPRDGLLVPYGSELFWDRMDHVIGLARARGLEVWFYDEFSFPSGADGGRTVARHPAARARQLRLVEIDPSTVRLLPGGLLDLGEEDLLAALRYRLTTAPDGSPRAADIGDITTECGTHRDRWWWTELSLADYLCTINVRQVPHERAVTTRTTWVHRTDAPYAADERILAIQLVEVPAHHGEAGMPDVALPEVTDLFLDAVYRRYADLAARHGLSEVPIFQDEVKYPSELPWNREIERRVRDLWGPDWRHGLLALAAPGLTADWEQRRWEYRSACAEALETNWFGRVADFCHGHGLRMTGHLAGEESIVGHSRLLGDAFATYARFDIPGYDVINLPGPDDVHRSQAKGAKLVQSAAWLHNKPVAMAEVMGATGFVATPRDTRLLTTWLALHEITVPVDHSTWSSTVGVRKYDAPPITNRFTPQAIAAPGLWHWHEWLVTLLERYRFAPHVLVLLPQESLARFQPSERDRWRSEVSLLETFFHQMSAATLDHLYCPSDALDEIEALPDGAGFRWHGHDFSHLVVPPVASLHVDTVTALERWADQPGLVWCHPGDDAHLAVFGATAVGVPDTHPITAVTRRACREVDLVAQGVSWFAGLLPEPAAQGHRDDGTPCSIVQSVRRAADGSEVLVLANPQREPVEIALTHPPTAAPLPQPPFDATPSLSGSTIRLAARDVVVVPWSGRSGAGTTAGPAPSRLEPHAPISATVTLPALSQVRLTTGTATLGHQPTITFDPRPVSLLWSLPEAPERATGELGPRSPGADRLRTAQELRVDFAVTLARPVPTRLSVLLDGESAPAGAELSWDGTVLPPESADILDVGNTNHRVPTPLLTPGEHRLTVRASVTHGWQGVLERPILLGDFLARPGAATEWILTRRPDGPLNWTPMQDWAALGLPQTAGPVDYEFEFELPLQHRNDVRAWQLVLPSCDGAIEITLDTTALGICAWGSGVVPVPVSVAGGRHRLHLRVHGSFNNLLSALARTSPGLSGLPQLVAVCGPDLP